MRIFSPSSTIKWKKCSQEYVYYKLGVQPRSLGNIDYGAMFGSAMSATMNCIHGKGDKADPKIVAHAYITDTIAQFNSYGVSLDYTKVDDRLRILDKTIDSYIPAINDILDARGWSIVASEWEIPNSGASRVDLLCQDKNGKHIVIDAKWKFEVKKAEYEQYAIDSYQHDWKMKHYCYFTGLHFAETILDYYILLGIASPKFKLQMIPYSISAHELRQWEISAKQAWADMDDPLRPITQAETHEDKFGSCPYYDLCFLYNGDYIGDGEIQYVQIGRSKA